MCCFVVNMQRYGQFGEINMCIYKIMTVLTFVMLCLAETQMIYRII